jgi:hypothetical protein
MFMEKTEETTLSTLLLSFAGKVIKKLKQLEETGQFTKKQLIYQKPSVSDFKYNGGGNVSYSTSFENILKEHQFLTDRKSFIETNVKTISEYSQIITAITKRKICSINEADSILNRLIQYLERNYPSLQPSPKSLFETIATFLSDIDNSPTMWKATVFLKGIWLEEESYQITDEIVIRRPNASDYEKETFAFTSQFGFGLGFPSASAVLELNLTLSSSMQVQQEINLLVNLLRLFKLGSVTYERYLWTSNSITRIGAQMCSGAKNVTHYKYELDSQQIPELSKFLPIMKPCFPNMNLNITNPDLGAISFNRYLDALIRPGPPESRITSAITCLESLYLKGEERMELSHRLAQRVSNLLRLLDLDYRPLEVYNKLILAYDIRSTFIHGASTKEEHRSRLPALCETVMQYARVSLLVFFQLKDTLKKERLINKLDNSLLDTGSCNKLKEFILSEVFFKQ